MNIEELLKKLDRQYEKHSDNSYTVALNDSDDFARTYTLLDNLEDSFVTVQIVDDKTTCKFIYNDYELNLVGDLKNDEYVLTIEELK